LLQRNSSPFFHAKAAHLEFWVDNLNPAFLYPILARQTSLCTDLLVGLTSHLRPAPYPYGLLALRLLGKLGGKNRRFLRNEIILPSMCTETALADLSMECQWPHYMESCESPLPGKFLVKLPLYSAVRALKTAAQINFTTLKPVKEREEDGDFGVVLRQISGKN
jgi:transformation/transcription domain-associated protein